MSKLKFTFVINSDEIKKNKDIIKSLFKEYFKIFGYKQDINKNNIIYLYVSSLNNEKIRSSYLKTFLDSIKTNSEYKLKDVYVILDKKIKDKCKNMLHFVFDLNLIFYDLDTKLSMEDEIKLPLGKSSYNLEALEKLVPSLTEKDLHLNLPAIEMKIKNNLKHNIYFWMSNMFADEDFSFKLFGYENDIRKCQIHFYISCSDNKNITKESLDRFMDEINSDDVDNWSVGLEMDAISEEEAEKYGFYGIEIYPSLNNVYNISENHIDLNHNKFK